ncbi:unnamed protein product [Rangifer tarandus platyrhynchus]|uniref:Uncharacterized protein n=2 Tax=Rangifer tarandus platyrhynchus TaxID=3082113 RepID=A0ACB1KHD2_RANTA|nr:unnamed protein product [Rangifer tarandus platyrhynchus]
MDCSPPGSSVRGFPGRNTEVAYHFLLLGIFLDQGSVFHRVSIACMCQSHLPFHPVTVPPHRGIHTVAHYNLCLHFFDCVSVVGQVCELQAIEQLAWPLPTRSRGSSQF